MASASDLIDPRTWRLGTGAPPPPPSPRRCSSQTARRAVARQPLMDWEEVPPRRPFFGLERWKKRDVEEPWVGEWV